MEHKTTRYLAASSYLFDLVYLLTSSEQKKSPFIAYHIAQQHRYITRLLFPGIALVLLSFVANNAVFMGIRYIGFVLLFLFLFSNLFGLINAFQGKKKKLF